MVVWWCGGGRGGRWVGVGVEVWWDVVRVYGNFDIMTGPFLTHFVASHRPPHAVRCALPSAATAHRMLIGACNPISCPNPRL